MVVSRLEPGASAPKAELYCLDHMDSPPIEGSQRSWRLQTRRRCLLTPRHTNHGKCLIDLFLGPCVSYSSSRLLDRLCPSQLTKYRAPVAARRLVPVPEPVGTTVLLFLLVVFMWRSYLLPNWERRLEENISATGPVYLLSPLFGQCKAVCVGFPYGFMIGMAFPSASIVAAVGALNLVTAAPIGPSQQQRCPQWWGSLPQKQPSLCRGNGNQWDQAPASLNSGQFRGALYAGPQRIAGGMEPPMTSYHMDMCLGPSCLVSFSLPHCSLPGSLLK